MDSRSPDYPRPSSKAVTAVMKGNRKRDTKPEVLLRSALHRRGHRFRKNYRIDLGQIKVNVDIAFPRAKVAVFVDGCFWHCCPEHGNVPCTNRDYWRQKLTRNVERDKEIDSALVAAGWQPLRVWEHVQVAEAAERVSSALTSCASTG